VCFLCWVNALTDFKKTLVWLLHSDLSFPPGGVLQREGAGYGKSRFRLGGRKEGGGEFGVLNMNSPEGYLWGDRRFRQIWCPVGVQKTIRVGGGTRLAIGGQKKKRKSMYLRHRRRGGDQNRGKRGGKILGLFELGQTIEVGRI